MLGRSYVETSLIFLALRQSELLVEGCVELGQGHSNLDGANIILSNNPSIGSIASNDQDHYAEENQWPIRCHRRDCNAVDITVGVTSPLRSSSGQNVYSPV